jgi:hypothetical protein
MGDMRNACTVLLRRSEGKQILGKLKCIWNNNIKMDVKEKGGKMWTGFLCQDRDQWEALVKDVKNLWSSIKGEEIY